MNETIKMIELKPFTEEDFEPIKSWVSNAEELFQFAGPIFSFPLTDAQLRKYLDMEDKKPFKVVLKNTKETIGHCELNYENGNHRLSRILVGIKDLRGKGIGEQIVSEMVQLFFQNPEINEVDLNTFDWNKAAIHCYEKVGFKINPEKSDKMTINGKEWTRINMSLKREHFSTTNKDGMNNSEPLVDNH